MIGWVTDVEHVNSHYNSCNVYGVVIVACRGALRGTGHVIYTVASIDVRMTTTHFHF